MCYFFVLFCFFLFFFLFIVHVQFVVIKYPDFTMAFFRVNRVKVFSNELYKIEKIMCVYVVDHVPFRLQRVKSALLVDLKSACNVA